MAHKFKLNKSVELANHQPTRDRRSSSLKISRLMPENPQGEVSYRIKVAERGEFVVLQHEIVAAVR